MISEGSCDTEDWSNDCWKFSFAFTGIFYILKYIKIEDSNCINSSPYYFLLIFLVCFTCIIIIILNKCSFGEQKCLFFQKYKKNHINPKLLNDSVHEQQQQHK